MTKSGSVGSMKSGDVEATRPGDVKGVGMHSTDAREIVEMARTHEMVMGSGNVEMAQIHEMAMGSGNMEIAATFVVVNWVERVWVARLLVEAVGSNENHNGHQHQGAGVTGVEQVGGVGVGRDLVSSGAQSARQGELRNTRKYTLERHFFFGAGASAVSSRISPSSGMNCRFFGCVGATSWSPNRSS